MNTREKRIRRRAEALYKFFQNHTDESFTMAEACAGIGASPGKRSSAAMRHVRNWAEADGWFFPPAVPAAGFRYVLTKDVNNLPDPALHMARIEVGVRKRKQSLLDGIRSGRKNLTSDVRPVAAALMAAEDFERDILERAHKFTEEVTRDLIATRREQRQNQ